MLKFGLECFVIQASLSLFFTLSLFCFTTYSTLRFPKIILVHPKCSNTIVPKLIVVKLLLFIIFAYFFVLVLCFHSWLLSLMLLSLFLAFRGDLIIGKMRKRENYCCCSSWNSNNCIKVRKSYNCMESTTEKKPWKTDTIVHFLPVFGGLWDSA